MTQSQSERSVWPIAAAIGVIAIILAAGIAWSLHHPFPVHWDEAIDINEAQLDTQRLQHGMLLSLGNRLLIKCWGRPPAYRLLALPFLGLTGFHTTTARLISLACFAFSSLFVYLSTRRFTRRAASAFATLIFSLSPVIISASIWFSTEGPLYLATSAMFYYLFKIWTEKPEQRSSWIGLGLAVGIGMLSKASFLAIVLPLMTFSLVAGLRRQFGIRNLASQRNAGLLALLIAMPWWLLNIKPAIAVAKQARGFSPNSLGPPSIATWAQWLNTVCQSLLGYGLSILICLVVVTWIYRAVVKKAIVLDPLERTALWACACAGVPIVAVQLTGTNHMLRHISPAVIPLAIAVGVLAGNIGWDRSHPFLALSGILFCLQLQMIVAPVLFPNKHPLESGFANAWLPGRVMARREQWNWEPVLRISHDCGADAPSIGYLGMGSTLNPPQIERPWVAAAASTGNMAFPRPDVRLLWRYEQGPLDWQKVMGEAELSDIVLTAPHYVGDVAESINNRYNAEFAQRLSSDQLFRSPTTIEMGSFEPVEVLVFVKKSLPCQLPERTAAKP
jgi:hypothetical protein